MNHVALLLLGLMAWSCSDSDSETSAQQMKLMKDGVEVSEMTFSIGGSSQMLGVFSDAEWVASLDDDSWCDITPHAGFVDNDSTQYIRVTVQKNEGEARKAVLTVKAGATTRTLLITQKGTETDAGDNFESVFAMINNLKVGYNLGNTLESNHNLEGNESWFSPSGPGDWQTYETCWGQPITTQAIIDEIVGKGFNIIRVPVTWFPHVDSDWNINEEWMDRVQQVVDMVISTGSYCIINVMHDTGERGETRTDNQCWLTTDASMYETNTVIYQKLWKQIAERFRDYDEHLIFESFNEILNASYSWTAPSDDSNGDYTTINKLQQDFVNTVRATGGNNEYRNLAVTTYSATGNSDAALDFFEVPVDVHSNHIYLTIHSYDPYNFCNDGGEWNILLFDADAQAVVDQVVERVSKRAETVGIPFIFGEFGAIAEGKDMNERVKYATYVAKKLKACNTTGLWWMGLYDRRANDWYESEIVDALNAVLQ